MSVIGTAVIDTLAKEAIHGDPGASSHWREQHADFRFTGDGFEGLRGFGGATPRHWHRRLGHRLLQRPFRALAADLPQFVDVDTLAHRICVAQGRNCDLHVLRHSLTVAWLKQVIPAQMTATSTACVIGDGFGTMTALLAGSRSAGRIVLVNLTRTLLVDLWYLRLWLGAAEFDRSVMLVRDNDGLRDALAQQPANGRAVVIAIQAQHHELIERCPIDLTFNMASMGEMDPPVTAEYFDDLRAAAAAYPTGGVFYCCNREEKRLPDGTVTRFADYPWRSNDRILVDELCPWHQRFYTKRPPFYHPYDGPVRHRLAILSPERPA